MRASSARFGVSKEWDGIWNVKTAHGDYGWSLEIEIPFRTLNFDESLDTWGINFQRTVRRKQEEMLWSGHRRNQGLFRAIHAGRLTGLTGITQGLGLEVKPYGATAWREVVDEGTEVPADVGFDLNYNLTSSLKTAVSVNTDFAETEVDRRRVNLTRFPTVLPGATRLLPRERGRFQLFTGQRGDPVLQPDHRAGRRQGSADRLRQPPHRTGWGARSRVPAGAYR